MKSKTTVKHQNSIFYNDSLTTYYFKLNVPNIYLNG